jgi:exodeoxyribonuclease-3
VRVVNWNIRAGGGKRTALIADVLLEESPDILVLTEFRPLPGIALLDKLSPLGYQAMAGSAEGPRNSVCVLSRYRMESYQHPNAPGSLHRWVAVRIPEHDLVVLGAHVPNQTEIWNKREFLDCLEGFAGDAAGQRAIMIGDLNTALDQDCEGEKIREAVTLKRIFEMGWVDAWRQCHTDAREFTWYSHRNNGFRLDQCLVSPSLASSVKSAQLRHDVRTGRLSDHSLLRVELG